MENKCVLPVHPPWEGGDSIWPATSLILHRNLTGRFFPTHMSVVDAEQTLDIITKSLAKLPPTKILRGDTLLPLDKEFLFEHFLLHEGFEKFDPGRALILDDSAHFLGLINVEDHLHMHLFAIRDELETAYQKLAHIELTLAKTLSFAYSDCFGYLTSDPRIAGTGLIVQAYLHLPAMIHLKQFVEVSEKIGGDVIIRGLGPESAYIADIVLIENRFKLGVTEENILKTVRTIATKFMEEEKQLRTHLKETDSDLLKDKIGRAFGLLSYAQTLQIQETLFNLSLFHLGKELGWIEHGESFDFFDLFFSTRRGHLQKLFQEKTTTKEAISQKRAEMVRDRLKDCILAI